MIDRIRGRYGLEIGGPSALFRRGNLWPVYPAVGGLDAYDFAARTLWSGRRPRRTWLDRLAGPPGGGRRFIGEAADMAEVGAATYDFVLASHVLEHLANPVRALYAWVRILKPGGMGFLVVPHRDGTFDHRRPVTALEHLVQDFATDVTERDDTHLDEILRLHDLSRDPGAGSREAFEARARRNVENRSLHHHVFDTELVLRLLDHVGLQLLHVDLQRPYHIGVACTLPDRTPTAPVRATDNHSWLAATATWRRRSPFLSDRNGDVATVPAPPPRVRAP